jgi:hypothetical protein
VGHCPVAGEAPRIPAFERLQRQKNLFVLALIKPMEQHMKIFELRYLDKNDLVITVRAFEGADDSHALTEAVRRSATHTIECGKACAGSCACRCTASMST